MKVLRILLLAAFVMLGVTNVAQAEEAMVRKVDSFDLLMDYSGSMMMTNQALKEVKISLAKDVLTKVNAAIPDLGYDASLHSFAPTGRVIANGSWNRDAMAKGIASFRNDLEVFGRLTPMGDGLMALGGDYAQMKTPTAVVIASDGASNRGIDPVAEARALYQSNPNLCFHVISLADTPEGEATLKNIAALKDCSVMVNAADMLADQAVVDQFVRDVFYTTAIEDAIILRGVNFAFDSYALDTNAKNLLSEVAVILKAENSANVLLEGWTDSKGTDAYNAVLSQRRADSVKDYLTKQGVSASSLRAVGMGKSFKYDNATKDGAYLNRRVELIFE